MVEGLFVFPMAAWLLWDDYRGWAPLAIAGVFTGAVGQAAIPLGSALIVYALTDSAAWAIAVGGGLLAALVLVGILPGEA